jgi:hypothetical protein
MRKPHHHVVAFLALLAVPSAALAWHDGGHATISLVAYRQLTPETRAKLDAILAQHPRYKEDLLAGCPAGANQAEYAFSRAGVWPDMVRSKSNPMSGAYHRPFWHYTDVPYFVEGADKTYNFKAFSPTKPGEPYDAVSAWKYNLARLNDPTVSGAERAVALCWVLHIGGDIHQPCHCVSLFSAKYPTGDKGGNDQFLDTGHERPDNVHFIWDAFLGDGLTPAQVTAQADRVTKEHDRASFGDLLKKTSIDDWVLEGQLLAIKYVYLDGKLQSASKKEVSSNAPVPKMTGEYKADGLALSLKQAALAGYRVGDALGGLDLPPSAPTTKP